MDAKIRRKRTEAGQIKIDDAYFNLKIDDAYFNVCDISLPVRRDYYVREKPLERPSDANKTQKRCVDVWTINFIPYYPARGFLEVSLPGKNTRMRVPVYFTKCEVNCKLDGPAMLLTLDYRFI